MIFPDEGNCVAETLELIFFQILASVDDLGLTHTEFGWTECTLYKYLHPTCDAHYTYVLWDGFFLMKPFGTILCYPILPTSFSPLLNGFYTSFEAQFNISNALFKLSLIVG